MSWNPVKVCQGVTSVRLSNLCLFACLFVSSVHIFLLLNFVGEKFFGHFLIWLNYWTEYTSIILSA